MIDDGPRPIVTEFVAEMLNDPRCESLLLDVREDARGGQRSAHLLLGRHRETMRVHSQHCGRRVLGVRSRSRHERNDNNDRGGKEVWELQELFAEIKTRLWGDK